MKKIIALAFAIGFGLMAQAQETGFFYGGFESNTQWLQNDNKLDFKAPDARFRGNNYFQFNYNYGAFTAGIQYEAYLPEALLDYEPSLNGQNGIGTYYVNYRDETLDITGGYFYDQFGSGLILRSYEDRQLGINSALRGVGIKFTPTYYLTLKGVYGKQRYGFDVSNGFIQGLDLNLDLGQLLNLDDWYTEIGGSYVGRYQKDGQIAHLPNTVNAYAARFDVTKGSFYGGLEYVQLDKKPLVNDKALENDRLFDGNAFQVNMGYAGDGLGIDGTFRRMDNFSFYSDYMAEGNQYNQELVHYVPALTKQQDYLLANIYVYQAQPRLLFNPDNPFEARSGEVGTQWDLFYTIDQGTALGGKYGTKIAANFSYWAGLDTDFNFDNNTYKTKFIGKGLRYYRDFNIEIKKRWSDEWSSAFTYMNQIIDAAITTGGVPGSQGDIKAQVGVAESTYEFGGGRSARLEVQHLWTKEDRGNWAGGMIEFNYNTDLSLFLADSWNYDGEGKTHYYNAGVGYTKGRTRLLVSYGRVRGGLLCVGGVCRFVSSSSGANMSLTVSF